MYDPGNSGSLPAEFLWLPWSHGKLQRQIKKVEPLLTPMAVRMLCVFMNMAAACPLPATTAIGNNAVANARCVKAH